MDAIKQEIKKFWGEGWAKRSQDDLSKVNKESCLREIERARTILEMEDSEQVREMKRIGVAGKSVLEIGCGAGTSSILFALDGAQVTASDLTAEAVAITKSKFERLGLDGTMAQADAEHLPFPDSSFDVVFSSGVLHHTPGTQKCMDEIYRVLKPGGDTVVMLYAKWSVYYLVGLFLAQGILRGGLFRYGMNWLGSVTETGWSTDKKNFNPMTKVYSGRQMRKMFKKFEIVGLRKHSFHWSELFPGLYRVWKRPKLRIGDTTVIAPSSIERALGRIVGFSLVIQAKKPA